MSVNEKTERIYSLDAIKFFATILIIFHHYQQSTGVRFSSINFFDGKFYVGYLVELFFIISGFLTWGQADRDRVSTFANYIRHKAIRLYPVPMISILVLAFAHWLFRIYNGFWWNNEIIGLWRLLTNLGLVFSGGGGVTDTLGINNPLWYICVLLICYILYWVLLKLADKMRINPICLFVAVMHLGACTIYGVLSFPLLYTSTGRGYLCFFWGVLLRYILDSKVSKSFIRKISTVVLIICAGAWLIDKSELYDNLQMILIFAVYPSLIILATSSNTIKYILNHKAFEYLGKISFEMYVWHIPVMAVLRLFTYSLGYTPHINFTTMIIFTLLMLAFSTTMFLFVEKPIDKRLK